MNLESSSPGFLCQDQRRASGLHLPSIQVGTTTETSMQPPISQFAGLPENQKFSQSHHDLPGASRIILLSLSKWNSWRPGWEALSVALQGLFSSSRELELPFKIWIHAQSNLIAKCNDSVFLAEPRLPSSYRLSLPSLVEA